LALAVPVIAGLAVGILVIIVFAFTFSSNNDYMYGTTPNNLNLSITGLKESYHAGEPITFTLRVTGYGDCYQTPNAAIWNASSAFASSPIWKSGTPALTCDSNTQFAHFINDTYHWGEDRNVTVATTGNYVFGARIGVNPAIQEEFTIITSDSANGNTSGVKCDLLSLCTYQLKAENSTYLINFRFNGTIEKMAVDGPTETLTIFLRPEGSTYLQIAIPREVVDTRLGVDSKSGADAEFAVFLDEQNVDANEFPKEAREWTKTLGISDNPEQYRMLSIAIPEGTETVEIVGTWLI
jgi:hypothetical protein